MTSMPGSIGAFRLERVAACALALALALGTSESGPLKGRRVVGECGGPRTPDDPAWEEWSELVHAAVGKAWKPPVSAKTGHPGLVLLQFRVSSDGSVSDLVLIKEKAALGMARAATEAVVTASPFPPLPPVAEAGIDHDAADGISISYLFAYNTSDKAACRFRDRWSP